MSKNFDQIVNIKISNPVVEAKGFDNLLILGPAPASAYTRDEETDAITETTQIAVASYTSLAAVKTAGWAETEDVYLAAQVAFMQEPKPVSIFIAPFYEGEEPTVGLTRALEVDGWYVVCPAGVPDEKIPALAALIEPETGDAKEKIMLYTETAFFTGNSSLVGTEDYVRSMWIFGKESSDQAVADMPVNNKYINVAFAAKWLNYESGTETAAFKTLTGVSAANLTETEINSIKTCGGNYFASIGGRGCTMNGMTAAGEWADVVRFRDWLKNDMQNRIANLFVGQSKIPYTDAGINLIRTQMEASLASGQQIGGISPDTFDSLGTAIPGYTIIVPEVADISPTQRASRVLTGLKFTARIGGAIHFTELEGSLVYDM